MTDNGLAVVAIGGNALIRDPSHESIPCQYEMVAGLAADIANMIESGWNVVVTHGNGPQVGYILRRSEISIGEVPPVPMDYAGADIQGAVGYMFVKALGNEFRKRGIDRKPVALVTQTLVDRDDPAFAAADQADRLAHAEARAKALAAQVRMDRARGCRPRLAARRARRRCRARSWRSSVIARARASRPRRRRVRRRRHSRHRERARRALWRRGGDRQGPGLEPARRARCTPTRSSCRPGSRKSRSTSTSRRSASSTGSRSPRRSATTRKTSSTRAAWGRKSPR